MNVKHLHTAVDYITYCRNILSNKQYVVVQNYPMLWNENNFEQVFLWGQILGLDNDYYIKDALICSLLLQVQV
jgi:hypothetical protein